MPDDRRTSEAAAPRPAPTERVCVGAIVAAHGVRGEVRVKCFTVAPENIAAYGPVEDEAGTRRFTLTIVGVDPRGARARIAGITERNAAEALRGARLYVARSALPQPGADEYYATDLEGLAAVASDGRDLGRVAAVHDYGAGAILEIAGADGNDVMVPFNGDAVPTVDLDARRVTIAAGIFDAERGGKSIDDGNER
ncbi:MAG: 16S rRNA processing protein RimM [Alphaproteobacteria bacterium]|nr:16S rRNA processing protein RimM [Alphaproteobacteria bacterium]